MKAGSSQLILTFKEELEKINGKAVIVKNAEEAIRYIKELIKERRISRIAVSGKLPLGRLSGKDFGGQMSVIYAGEITDHKEIAKAELGITAADFAIASTGSIAITTKTESERLVSSLPPIHLALVRSEDTLPSLQDALARMKKAVLENGENNVLTIITGPSRTADLEQQIITGVHGPTELHAVVIEES